jgi:excisionase family DNA binding protein
MSDNTQTTSDNLPAVIVMPAGVSRLSDLGTLYTLKETATKLGVSAKTVRRMIDRGELPGAHQAPMANGKGTQWVVPYSSVIAHENKTQTQTTPDPVNAELIALRERVAQLENSLTLQRELATERAHQLEQLHTTFRVALNAGEEPKRRGLFRRK